MPKIDVNEELFFKALGLWFTKEELLPLLPLAKAEFDKGPQTAGILRIELNDTNRPDLWSTMGLARQFAAILSGKIPSYPFFSRTGDMKKTAERRVVVGAGLKDVRPFIASFVAEGKEVTEPLLREIIQFQEKLCGLYGRRRKMVAMGVSRADLVSWPIHYDAADPDATKFVPLDFTTPMSMRAMLSEHPKGKDYGPLVSSFKKFPLLSDDTGQVLTFPPVINSALIGGVKPGDKRLFVDLTGPDLEIILTACAIVACDFADMGFTILPVTVEYPWDTPWGRNVVTPLSFQKEITLDVADASRRLGEKLTAEQAAGFIRKMGSAARVSGQKIVVSPPEFRNDFLHPVDAIEEIMIGRGMESFVPVMPKEFTPGRVLPATEYGRRVRESMIGLGYQEMIYPYLGSRADIVDRMGIDGSDVVEIGNPMTESADTVRNSIIPSLLGTEAASAHAAYPHRVFEIGKVVRRDAAENYGSRTHNTLGFLVADREAGFNEVDSHVLALFYYLAVEPQLSPVEDPRFIPGRAARITVNGRVVGILGEVHPRVLENWGIQMPCAAAEISLDLLRGE